jgi:ATP-binding cassette subfamily B protein
MKKPATVNYLNNKDILKEINKSKLTYCYVQDEKYSNYDVILRDINDINDQTIAEARRNKSAKLQSEGYAAAMLTHDKKDYKNKPKQKEFAIDPDSFDVEDLVFRIMCMDHIPEEEGRKKNPKSEADIQKAITNILKDRTVIVIAHRLSTIRRCDEILVMKHGKIIERGSHNNLLSQKGSYYQLHSSMINEQPQ